MIIEKKTIISVNPSVPAEYRFFQQSKAEWEKGGYIIKCEKVIKDADGNWVYSNGDINGTLTFTMPKKAVNITAYFWADWPTQGAGTAEDPYIISSAEDWNRFAHNVTLGRTYSGSHVKLTNNISVSNPAGGSTTYSFQSTFDSDGHTLTFNNSGWTEKFIAPFR